MKAIQNAVMSGGPVECTIQYTQYEGKMDFKEWSQLDVPDGEKMANDEFRQMQTV